jgi:hypothetical protein
MGMAPRQTPRAFVVEESAVEEAAAEEMAGGRSMASPPTLGRHPEW